jgi:serine/threonine protein phosphatase PrpC
MAHIPIRFFAATDVGKVRDHNEDNFLVDKKLGLFVVCDGMGGHAAGEVASAIAVRTMHDELQKESALLDDFLSGATGAARVTPREVVALLDHAVQAACSKIHTEAAVDSAKRGMGTTLSALLVLGARGFVAHVGDSRIYLMRAGQVHQITEDHTVVNELIKRGKLTREQIEKIVGKNAITRAVGVYERVEVDTLAIELLPGDCFVLASDGLTGYLQSPEELGAQLEQPGDSAVKSLTKLANDRGGKDNITTVIVKLGEDGVQDEARARRVALKREVLANMRLFAHLTERELLRVLQAVEVRPYQPGQLVIDEGAKGDELFVVLSGRVCVMRGDDILSSLGEGEHFGEMALIRSAPRSATVRAEAEGAELIVIRRADFFEILRKEHELAVKLLWQFLGVFADRLEKTTAHLHTARQELLAEDLSSDILPIDEDIDVSPFGVPPDPS